MAVAGVTPSRAADGSSADALRRHLRQLTVERGLSKHTVAAYRRDLEAYLASLAAVGVTDVREIDAGHVSAFHASLAERGLAASSIARHLSSVRGLHRFMLEEGFVDDDVAALHRPPKLPSRLPKAISIGQMQTLLEAATGESPTELRDAALVETLYATGARVSEAIGLDVDDVAGAELVRLTGKGGKQRLVPLGSMARAAIDAYLVRARPLLAARAGSTPALFLGARGARLSRQSAWLVIQRVAEASGLGLDMSPHTFRHSFATHLLEGGADVRVVQELLGHSSVATTQIYTLVTADTLRDMYQSAHPRARRR